MRIFISLVVTILLCSCVTQKRCNERYPPVQSDSIRTWITYECIVDTVYVPSNELVFDTIGVIPHEIIFHHVQTKGHLSQTIDIHNGSLVVICNEQAYKDTVEYLRQTLHEKDSRIEFKEVPVRDGWYNFWKMLAIVSTSLLLICIGGLLYVK